MSRLRGAPRMAWACALIAFLNAACWSLITPPFQVPDEPSHFAYAQSLAETGALPSSESFTFSPALEVALRDLESGELRYSPQNHAIFSQTQQRRLEGDLVLPYSRVSSDAGSAASEPPLYYALEVIPYELGSGGTLLDSLALMRLFSAVLGGATALFVCLFLREALPREPWAWAVGGLGVAFAPLLAMMSGAVNSDALLFAISAALFYLLARGFRRALTPALASCIGLAMAAGIMTKLNFLGLLPGILLGLLLLTARARRISASTAYRSLALALGIAAAPLVLYVFAKALFGGASSQTLSGSFNRISSGSILKEASYIWQFYLPSLPGMHDYFPGLFTTRQFWIDGFVGLYGWVDTVFPGWVYTIALIPMALLGALLARALLLNRAQLRARGSELAVYVTLAAGLLALVGSNDYLVHATEAGSYAQPRYLLPLIALYGGGLALAARGAGRRWGPLWGASIVLLLIAHDVFSQLLEISRYYG